MFSVQIQTAEQEGRKEKRVFVVGWCDVEGRKKEERSKRTGRPLSFSTN